MSWEIRGSKPYIKLYDRDTAHTATISNDGSKIIIDNDIGIEKQGPGIHLTDTGSGTSASIGYDGSAINVDRDVKHAPTGASLLAHGQRHSRGGEDQLDWSRVSRYRVSTGTATIGVSGSPALIASLSVSENYYNLLPLRIDYGIAGLGTGETFTLTVNAVLDDGTTVTLYSKAGLTAGGSVTIADIDASKIGDTRQVRRIEVYMESSATSTSATGTATITALET